jgi:uncharacterized short protein YbdD (DUF466 family)
MRPLQRKLAFWCRQVTGEDAYERYCAHLKAQHPHLPVPTRAQFFREQQERKWQGVTRCC